MVQNVSNFSCNFYSNIDIFFPNQQILKIYYEMLNFLSHEKKKEKRNDGLCANIISYALNGRHLMIENQLQSSKNTLDKSLIDQGNNFIQANEVIGPMGAEIKGMKQNIIELLQL